MSKPLAIIVAHGSPSVPVPLDLWMKVLAERVADLTPHYQVCGATLGMRRSLEAELAKARPGEPITIYPFFMSDGWFTKVELPRRARAATDTPMLSLPAFGLDQRVPEVCARVAADALRRRRQEPKEAALVLAAHGSMKNPASANAARVIQAAIVEMDVFGSVSLGFVEEPPSITEAAMGLAGRPAVCLPLFATRGGHVTGDIPDQLAAAEFSGILLDPVGESTGIEAIVADALARHAQEL